MAKFDDLPPEILDCVIAAINGDRIRALSRHQNTKYIFNINFLRQESKNTLLNLCLTSTRLRALAEPHLYRLWDSNLFGDTAFWNDCHQDSLQRFLRAIILRPDLSRHVHHIGASNWRIWSRGERDSLLSVDDQQVLHNVAERKGLPGLDSTQARGSPGLGGWRSSLEAGSADPLIALLLALTPNLRSIFFGVPQGSYWPRKLFGLASSGHRPESANGFARLQKITYRMSEDRISPGNMPYTRTADDRRLRFNETIPFFWLPSIRTIVTDMSWDPYGPQNIDKNRSRIYYPLPRGTSTITRLKLKNISIKPRVVEGILRSCRALESLSLSYNLRRLSESADFPEVEDYLAVVNPKALGAALSCVKHSLRHLKLRITSDGVYRAIDTSIFKAMLNPLGSLREFERLSTVDVSLFMLLGFGVTDTPRLVDLLPGPLEQLTIDDDDGFSTTNVWDIERLLPHITALAVDGPTHLPSLKLVDMTLIHGEPNFGVHYAEEEQELVTAFEKNGVKFHVLC